MYTVEEIKSSLNQYCELDTTIILSLINDELERITTEFNILIAAGYEPKEITIYVHDEKITIFNLNKCQVVPLSALKDNEIETP